MRTSNTSASCGNEMSSAPSMAGCIRGSCSVNENRRRSSTPRKSSEIDTAEDPGVAVAVAAAEVEEAAAAAIAVVAVAPRVAGIALGVGREAAAVDLPGFRTETVSVADPGDGIARGAVKAPFGSCTPLTRLTATPPDTGAGMEVGMGAGTGARGTPPALPRTAL